MAFSFFNMLAPFGIPSIGPGIRIVHSFIESTVAAPKVSQYSDFWRTSRIARLVM
jgi:hypothetical protein